MSFEPLRNPLGFGIPDFIEFALAALLLAGIFLWPVRIRNLAQRLAARPLRCMALLATVPIILRLSLLASHPVPTPDLYDEFGHLLVADTLRHGRLANPAHPFARFFETFFVLQDPTYSAIYPIGNGLILALGWVAFGTPWAGVLLSCGLLSAASSWMLKGWMEREWALLGGIFCIVLYGHLNHWTNTYWGGALPSAAGCLVFGALPRIARRREWRDGAVLGLGFAIHLLTRPYESVYLGIAVAAWLFHARSFRSAYFAAPIVVAALGLTGLHNKRVTGEWTTLPYTLSQHQYGVPAALTFQPDATPHRALTREQQLDYQMQSGFLAGSETLSKYTARLLYRIRYYRFYFYPPMYLALAIYLLFAIRAREFQWLWVPTTCLLFALGINFFPQFQFHYLAGVVCLFLLMTVKGFERLSMLRHGPLAVQFLIALVAAQFLWAHIAHVADKGGYDQWTSINHTNPERRIEVAREIEKMEGRLLIFVRYWPAHPFQEEWVYNGADIDSQRVVWARDLGDAENRKLVAYYPGRLPMLLEPDARPPLLTSWTPQAAEPLEPQNLPSQTPPKKPLLELEQVR